jgi:hypothetical protein
MLNPLKKPKISLKMSEKSTEVYRDYGRKGKNYRDKNRRDISSSKPWVKLKDYSVSKTL